MPASRSKLNQQPLPFGPIYNSDLLANHWLEKRLPREPEWQELRNEAEKALNQLAALWNKQREHVAQYSESQLEYEFIRPVFDVLGWSMTVQPSLDGRQPDYALFADDEAKSASGRQASDFWSHPLLVADAKAWTVDLDIRQGSGAEREYPPQQIEWYLDRSRLDYGILSNGQRWRLVPRDREPHQRRFQTYYEVDLCAILESWHELNAATQGVMATDPRRNQIIDDFRCFYLFFRPEAFQEIEQHKPLIHRAVEGSSEYRLGVSEQLKGRMFEAIRLCIEGFLKHPSNRLTAKDLPRIREHSFTLLYRLLFIMYAEDRGLLPLRSNAAYTRNRSLAAERDRVGQQLDQIAQGRADDYPPSQTNIYDHLRDDLFDLINHGHKTYGVARYNGGLFDPSRHQFLENHTLPDAYAARIIDRLSRARDPQHRDAGLVRVDYRDLAIQHLGGVYEGLLEQQPFILDEPHKVIRKRTRSKTSEQLVAADKPTPRGWDTIATRAAGDIEMQTAKGERRASGSYYTPDHIVDYIVENTLGPLCDRIGEQLQEKIDHAEKEHKRTRGDQRQAWAVELEKLRGDFDNRVLQLRVLDPSMGSGHFLLRACQYLAEQIATNPNAGDPASDEAGDDEATLSFWKRRVVERCLYGVDLNPMAVELAKLALWLETVAVNQPLSFLDHHLRHGNALVGADVDAMGVLPGAPPLQENMVSQHVAQRLPVMLRPLLEIRAMPSDDADQVKEKEKLYGQAFDKVRRPLRMLADLWVSAAFPGEDQTPIDATQYSQAVAALGQPKKFAALASEPWFTRALAAAGRRTSDDDSRLIAPPDMPPFHWELEFPECFFTEKGPREDQGFDAVIGNPPYDVLSDKETGRELTHLKAYIKGQTLFDPSRIGKNNLYKLFICRGVSLLAGPTRDGHEANPARLGFITPMAVLGDKSASGLRKLILEQGAFTSIDVFPQKDDAARRVFPEAKLSTAVFTLLRSTDSPTKDRPFRARVHPANYCDDSASALDLTTADIPRYDPANLTIVSCAQEDWDLATRIVRGGRMRRLGEFCSFSQGEVNETVQREKGNLTTKAEGGVLVTRGASICLYTARPASQGNELYLNKATFLDGASCDSKAYHHLGQRVAVQESCPQNNFRRVIAAPINAGEFCNHKVNYVPERNAKIPLAVIAALLNSKLADWYFRLGSTNAAVSHYQLENLPCPAFAPMSDADRVMLKAAIAACQRGDLEAAFKAVRPGLENPPFSPAVRDFIVELVQRITQIEKGRGEITRNQRSRLDPTAQPYQNLIDRLFYAMAGLTDTEADALERRLERML